MVVTGFKRLVVQRNWRHPWLKQDQTLQWLGQVLTVCSLSTPHHLLVPVRVPCSTEHTVLAQKMKGSTSSCACCQHNKKTFLWGHCERAVVARGHLCSLLRAVELIKPGEFPPFGSCRYFVCFLCCSFTLLGVFKQVGDFFSLLQLPCSLPEELKLCILSCFLRRLPSQLTQTAVAPIRHHSKLITTMMIT